MLILAIETSCDDTACAVLKITGKKQPKFKVLASVVSSQVKVHSPYGGVVPTLASREHLKNLPIVFEKTMKKAKISMERIDYIAVTQGPGLVIALLVGIHFAKGLAFAYNKKIIPVNHISGHIFSNWLLHKKIRFPLLNIVVSGGHTELILMKQIGKYKILGQTRDDAAGEAFDKTAKMLKLGYPGGPIISKLAQSGDPKSYLLPRPMLYDKTYDFSFSGLKTAVLNLLKNKPEIAKKSGALSHFCASFEQAVADTIIGKTIRAAKEHKVKTIALSGGVSANTRLRTQLAQSVRKEVDGADFFMPPSSLSTDNAIMIGIAAYFNQISAQSWEQMDAKANLAIG